MLKRAREIGGGGHVSPTSVSRKDVLFPRVQAVLTGLGAPEKHLSVFTFTRSVPRKNAVELCSYRTCPLISCTGLSPTWLSECRLSTFILTKGVGVEKGMRVIMPVSSCSCRSLLVPRAPVGFPSDSSRHISVDSLYIASIQVFKSLEIMLSCGFHCLSPTASLVVRLLPLYPPASVPG